MNNEVSSDVKKISLQDTKSSVEQLKGVLSLMRFFQQGELDHVSGTKWRSYYDLTFTCMI